VSLRHMVRLVLTQSNFCIQGSTLEKICKTPIVATPLWSAEALDKEPEAIVAAHLAFLRAGAKIIETSTLSDHYGTVVPDVVIYCFR